LALGLAVTPGTAGAAPTDDPFVQRLEAMYDDIEMEYRPDVRWWLAEGLNTDETLRQNVQQIYDAGFGAAEFLAMPEPSADSNIYGWGSDEWTADTRLIIEEATRLGLGFSLTSGTHWAHANLPDSFVWQGQPYDIDNKGASKELDYATILLDPGAVFDGALPAAPVRSQSAAAQEYVFQGVVAGRVVTGRTGAGQDFGYAEGTGDGLLDLASVVDLSDQVVESGGVRSLDWTAPADGQYALFVYWMHGTGQTAIPSVSTNYTINYIDEYGVQALQDYWQEFILTSDLEALLQTNGRGEIYMDSLELASYGAAGTLWGYNFKQEFSDRRGYDLTPYLPFISSDSTRVRGSGIKPFDWSAADPVDQVTIEKVRNDFYRSLTDMYRENVLEPLQSWLHSLDMSLRAEPSYGTLFEISTPAQFIDGIETESFSQNADVDLYRGFLGSANMYGRLLSSETGAVRASNYYYDMDYWTQLAYLQFAGGVSRTVFHGYSGIEGSEGDTYWPGHEGMYSRFSERFNSRQPAFAQYPEWTAMLARNQKVLRQGQPQRDIAILRTDNYFMSYGNPDDRYPSEYGFAMYDEPYYWRDLTLQHAGYTYDYFSPQLLEDTANVDWTDRLLQPDGPSYQAVIVYQEEMELASAQRLLEIARDGLPVVFVNNTSEARSHNPLGGMIDLDYGQAASVSRYLDDSDADLAAVVDQIKALPNVREIDDQSATMDTLLSLGVAPRAAFAQPNNTILTQSRLDQANGILYTYAYSFKFEVGKDDPTTTFELSLDAVGQPYLIDDWTGRVTPVGTYEIRDGRTHVSLTLQTGESVLIALDLSSTGQALHAVSSTADAVLLDGGTVAVQASQSGTYRTVLSDGRSFDTTLEAPAPIALERWDIVVEDWNAGDKVVNLETKFGHTTTEVYYTTAKTPLTFSNSPLLPWKDLPATANQLASLAGPDPSMSDVSGVGTYTTDFTLPADWSSANGAHLQIGSTNGGSAQVFVNGQKAPGLDLRTLQTDVSALLRPGQNTITVTVASTLTNRMLQRDYQDNASQWTDVWPTVQDYGLVGPVSLQPYTVAQVWPQGGPTEEPTEEPTGDPTGGPGDQPTDQPSQPGGALPGAGAAQDLVPLTMAGLAAASLGFLMSGVWLLRRSGQRHPAPSNHRA
jgi:hypothetical protein